MESGEHHEPSYYEVALTNRQVLVAFVALLTCLLVAFLSGVWIGRGGATTARVGIPPATGKSTAIEAPLEQLTFFNGETPATRTTAAPRADETTPVETPPPSAPASASPAAKPAEMPKADASDAMRENLEATMAANRESPAMKLAVGERTGTPIESAPAKPPAAITPVAAAAAKPTLPPATGRTFVQVYSSNNGPRAREIVALLRQAGFPVVMAETPKGGGMNYRVRVGPFDSRTNAEAAAVRLRRDHRLDTWVTDSP